MERLSNARLTIEARTLRSRRNKRIEIFVSAGSFSKPYYTFSDKKGRRIESFELDPTKRYRFRRADKASTHPFYISNQGWNQPATRQIKLKGDGDHKNGIIKSENLILSIKKKHQKDFSTSGRLFFYCTSHPSMLDEFIINAGRRRAQQRTSEETFETPKHPTAAEHIEHQQLTSQADTFPLMTAAPWTTETTPWDSAITILNIRP